MKKIISIILLCILSAMLVLPFAGCGKAHPHPIIEVKAKKETCGANGMKAHYFCEYCLSYFEDKDGKKPIKKGELMIAATGNHTPGPDNFYCFDEALSKWMHDIRCDVCQGPINLDPIECPKCRGEALDVEGNVATCKNQTCLHQFTIG